MLMHKMFRPSCIVTTILTREIKAVSKDSTKPLQEFQRNVTLPYAIDERVNLRASLFKDAWL